MASTFKCVIYGILTRNHWLTNVDIRMQCQYFVNHLSNWYPKKKRANCHVLPCLSMANLWVRSGVLGERLSPRTRAFGANSQVAEAVACFRDFFWMILLGITMGVFYWYLMGKPWDYIFLDESFEISKNDHNHQIIIITFLSFSYTTW